MTDTPGNFAYDSASFQKVGFSTVQTYNVGGTAITLVGTPICWFALMPYAGRQASYHWVTASMTAIPCLIGILNLHTRQHSFALKPAVLTLVWTFVFHLSAGQLGAGVLAEIGSTRLRQKTVCLVLDAYYIVGVVANIVQPYFMNPLAWNLKGYMGFVWGGTCFLMFVWGYFRLSETKDRTFDELDVLFAERVSARQVQVDIG